MKDIKIKPELFDRIKTILKESPVKEDVIHAELVLKWVLQLKNDADEALQIAAFSHDIDRAISKITESELKNSLEGYAKYKEEHAGRSAKYIAEILKEYKYPLKTIKKISELVKNHEVGGDKESDILRDADSLAYFEYNIPSYIERNGEEKAKRKIQFMYKRASSKVKKIIEAMEYKNTALKNLVKKTVSEI